MILIIKKLENYLIDLKNSFYLLEDEIDKKIREKLIKAERRFDKTKGAITKNAESLFEDINIVEKIPTKF